MSKSNPLFVDSTKFLGDRIGSQFELTDVMVYDDECLIVKITDHQGEEYRVAMQSLNDTTYVARVWLNHQKQICYQFAIEKNGDVVMSSVPYRGRAQYVIIEKWEPQLEGVPVELYESSPEQPLPMPDTPWTGDYASTVQSLILKWGL